MGVGGQRHAPAALLSGKRPGTHCIGGWWAPGPVWTCAENLAPTEIRSPDRPARSESLYRMNYPGPKVCVVPFIIRHLICLYYFVLLITIVSSAFTSHCLRTS